MGRRIIRVKKYERRDGIRVKAHTRKINTINMRKLNTKQQAKREELVQSIKYNRYFDEMPRGKFSSEGYAQATGIAIDPKTSPPGIIHFLKQGQGWKDHQTNWAVEYMFLTSDDPDRAVKHLTFDQLDVVRHWGKRSDHYVQVASLQTYFKDYGELAHLEQKRRRGLIGKGDEQRVEDPKFRDILKHADKWTIGMAADHYPQMRKHEIAEIKRFGSNAQIMQRKMDPYLVGRQGIHDYWNEF